MSDDVLVKKIIITFNFVANKFKLHKGYKSFGNLSENDIYFFFLTLQLTTFVISLEEGVVSRKAVAIRKELFLPW